MDVPVRSSMEFLKDWTVQFISDSSEGYCWQKEKRIDIGLSNPNPLRLLLHEIAHVNNNFSNNKHNQKWFDDYKNLMKKYMPNTPMDKSDEIIKEVHKLK